MFSDEDLKRFQDRDKSRSAVFICQEAFTALIARLEAAEACLANAEHFYDGHINAEKFDAWRRAAGKS